MQTTRSSMAQNYYKIWKLFNHFILKLDVIQTTWERRLSLYGAYLVDKGVQSATLKSYFSAIKKILLQIDYELDVNKLLLHTLTKACRIVNNRVQTRLPIKQNLLELILFEVQRVFKNQFYLEKLYTAVLLIMYYSMLRIGEVTAGPHVLKAANVDMGRNKNKILLVLYSSKTHSKESRPQQIKIAETIQNCKKLNNKFFCPFSAIRNFMILRGGYQNDQEQFFILSYRSPLTPKMACKTLKL